MKHSKRPRNVVGPVIRKLRYKYELTQPMLAARCHALGWELSRETLAKIETQLRWVSDFELVCLARALRVKVTDLLEEGDISAPSLRKMFPTRES